MQQASQTVLFPELSQPEDSFSQPEKMAMQANSENPNKTFFMFGKILSMSCKIILICGIANDK
jgi:hypothetical protein